MTSSTRFMPREVDARRRRASAAMWPSSEVPAPKAITGTPCRGADPHDLGHLLGRCGRRRPRRADGRRGRSRPCRAARAPPRRSRGARQIGREAPISPRQHRPAFFERCRPASPLFRPAEFLRHPIASMRLGASLSTVAPEPGCDCHAARPATWRTRSDVTHFCPSRSVGLDAYRKEAPLVLPTNPALSTTSRTIRKMQPDPTDWIDALPRDRLIGEFSLWSADLLRLGDELARIAPARRHPARRRGRRPFRPGAALLPRSRGRGPAGLAAAAARAPDGGRRGAPGPGRAVRRRRLRPHQLPRSRTRRGRGGARPSRAARRRRPAWCSRSRRRWRRWHASSRGCASSRSSAPRSA